ncbi:hypothetical protein F4808DRAFT_246523 [Astrocystis sublimbata]|nr:hypothetical protein F4808DRAFT_246523 [Astrocystis sublimbata]
MLLSSSAVIQQHTNEIARTIEPKKQREGSRKTRTGKGNARCPKTSPWALFTHSGDRTKQYYDGPGAWTCSTRLHAYHSVCRCFMTVTDGRGYTGTPRGLEMKKKEESPRRGGENDRLPALLCLSFCRCRRRLLRLSSRAPVMKGKRQALFFLHPGRTCPFARQTLAVPAIRATLCERREECGWFSLYLLFVISRTRGHETDPRLDNKERRDGTWGSDLSRVFWSYEPTQRSETRDSRPGLNLGIKAPGSKTRLGKTKTKRAGKTDKAGLLLCGKVPRPPASAVLFFILRITSRSRGGMACAMRWACRDRDLVGKKVTPDGVANSLTD